MQRRVLLEILGVAVLAALYPRLALPATRPKLATPALAAEGWNLCGVQPGMTRARVEALLGPPDYSGPLAVADNRKGTYVEYGSTKPTWNGQPTIVFDADTTVISVIAGRASVGAAERLHYGDSEQSIIDSMGSDGRVERYGSTSHLSRKLPEGDLELSFSEGHLTEMILCRGKSVRKYLPPESG